MAAARSVLVIVVTYNAERWLDTCLGSLRAVTYPLTVAVVDNASTDGTVELIRQNYGDVVDELFPLAENLGFGKAHNYVADRMDLAAYDYLFLLNQDAAVEPATIGQLVAVAEDRADAAVVSPQHYYAPDQFDHMYQRYITNLRLGSEATEHGRVTEVSFVNAALWLMRTSVVRALGFFDPIFDHYGEDTNYVNRVRAAGYRVLVAEAARGYHYRPQKKHTLNQPGAQANAVYISSLCHLLHPEKNFPKGVAGYTLNFAKLFGKSLLKGDVTAARTVGHKFGRFLRVLPAVTDSRRRYREIVAASPKPNERSNP